MMTDWYLLYPQLSAGDDVTKGVINLVILIYLVELGKHMEFENLRHTLRVPAVAEEYSSSTALEDDEFILSL